MDDRREPEEVRNARHARLLEAIGAAVGLEGAYPEVYEGLPHDLELDLGEELPAGVELTVLGGAVDEDSGRVAWIEQRWREPRRPDGYVDVSIRMHLAADGVRMWSRDVPSYNPYFGCRVHLMRWYGDTLAVIYHEKHRTLLWRCGAAWSVPPALVAIDGIWRAVGDEVYSVGREPGLIGCRSIRTGEAGVPIPSPEVEGTPRLWCDAGGLLWNTLPDELPDEVDRDEAMDECRRTARRIGTPAPHQVGFAGEPRALWRTLAAWLAGTGAPANSIELLIGAVGFPFWLDVAPHGSSYDEVRSRWSTLHWLPVYWHRHLQASGRTREARAWFEWLERVGGLEREEGGLEGWRPEWALEVGVERLARRYLSRRARVLARVCRTGRLPEGQTCYLWRHGWPLAQPIDHFPPGFQAVYRALEAVGPEPLK